MEPATISALAALAGATIGGVTSFAATWLTQRTQARIQAITHKLSRREELIPISLNCTFDRRNYVLSSSQLRCSFIELRAAAATNVEHLG